MGNKEAVLKYTMDLGMRGIRLDTSLLSDHRRRVIMMYIQEDMDAMNAEQEARQREKNKLIPRAVDTDARMEDDSVLEESDIACHQEVMTGYKNKPIVPTSCGVEPLCRRCAPCAECNETISFVPKQIASANIQERSSIIHKSPLVNDYEIASAKVRNLTCSIPERVIYKPISICNTSPRYATDPRASAITNLACRTQCRRLATFYGIEQNSEPGLFDGSKSSYMYVDDDWSLSLAQHTTSDYIGFNHLAHIKGEKITGDMIYPVTPPVDFSGA